LAALSSQELNSWTEQIKEAAKPPIPVTQISSQKKIPGRWEITPEEKSSNRSGGISVPVQQPFQVSQPTYQYNQPQYTPQISQQYSQPQSQYTPQISQQYSQPQSSQPTSLYSDFLRTPSAPQQEPVNFPIVPSQMPSNDSQKKTSMFPNLQGL